MFGFSTVNKLKNSKMLTLVQKAMESNQQYLFEIDAAILRNKQLQKVFANREVVSSRSHDARSRLKLLNDD